jgi:hypothetical protein
MHNQHKFGANHIQILPHEFSLYKDWPIWIEGGSFSETKENAKIFWNLAMFQGLIFKK